MSTFAWSQNWGDGWGRGRDERRNQTLPQLDEPAPSASGHYDLSHLFRDDAGKRAGTINYSGQGDVLSELERSFADSIPGHVRRDPGFQGHQLQIQENRRALDAQKPYADTAIDEVRGGALGAANTYFRDGLNAPGGPEAINQATFDRIVAQQMEAANAAAASRTRNLESEAARTGASPAAVAATRNTNVWQNANDQSAALRDLFVQREAVNKDYGLRFASAAADAGGAYNEDVVPALYARAGLDQPADFQSLGEYATGRTDLQFEREQQQKQFAINTLMALVQSFLGFGGDLANASATRAAAGAGSSNDWIAPATFGLNAWNAAVS